MVSEGSHVRRSAKRSQAERLLPSPGVRFGADFLPRLGRLIDRLENARERSEGPGRSSLFGVGVEFVGFRPYRPGEDLRRLDMGLWARLRKPFVRVARREASERWTVWLDTSASMGVGAPGKLQAGAELATAVAALGLRHRAVVELWTSAEPRSFQLRRPGDLAGWMRFLEEERAHGDGGLARLVREPRGLRGAGRLFAIGDLLDVERAGLLACGRRGRELALAQLLAREELFPALDAAGGVVAWLDPESGDRVQVALDPEVRDAYLARLGEELEAWRHAASHRRASYGCWTSDEPFERIVEAWL